jgi:hypothetical protein
MSIQVLIRSHRRQQSQRTIHIRLSTTKWHGGLRADLDTRQSGIYTGPDPIADKVIEIHDPLFDSRVMFIAESALLNEAG